MAFVVFSQCIGFRSFGIGSSAHADLGRVRYLIDDVADQPVDNNGSAIDVGAGGVAGKGSCRIFGTTIMCICLFWGVRMDRVREEAAVEELTRETAGVAVSSTDPCGVGSAAIIRLVRLL